MTTYMSGDQLPPLPATPPERRDNKRLGTTKKKWIVGGVVAAVLLGGGIAIGTTLPDPMASEQYRALAADKAAVEEARDEALSDYATLEADQERAEAAVASREEVVEQRAAELTTSEAAVKEAAAVVKKREEAVSGAEEKKAAKTVTEGQWTVGSDIEPGTYRVTEPITGRCYWVIHATGTNGRDIIANDLPTGGPPTVTLSVGQDFTTKRCGSWQKQ